MLAERDMSAYLHEHLVRTFVRGVNKKCISFPSPALEFPVDSPVVSPVDQALAGPVPLTETSLKLILIALN
jgi:hypothetical protein